MGYIGEDYDKFERIRTSTCLPFKSKLIFFLFFFMISQWGILVLMISQCYPVGFGNIIYIVDE